MDDQRQPKAVWLFATDTCGTCGFSDMTIAHAGRSDALGQIVLMTERKYECAAWQWASLAWDRQQGLISANKNPAQIIPYCLGCSTRGAEVLQSVGARRGCGPRSRLRENTILHSEWRLRTALRLRTRYTKLWSSLYPACLSLKVQGCCSCDSTRWPRIGCLTGRSDGSEDCELRTPPISALPSSQ